MVKVKKKQGPELGRKSTQLNGSYEQTGTRKTGMEKSV